MKALSRFGVVFVASIFLSALLPIAANAVEPAVVTVEQQSNGSGDFVLGVTPAEQATPEQATVIPLAAPKPVPPAVPTHTNPTFYIADKAVPPLLVLFEPFEIQLNKASIFFPVAFIKSLKQPHDKLVFAMGGAIVIALPSAELPLVPPGTAPLIKKPIPQFNTSPSYEKQSLPSTVPYNVTGAPALLAARPAADKKPTQTAAKEDKPVAVGRVIWVKGEFTAERKGKEPRILDKESIIFVGDTLITDNKTQAQIAFTDTTLLTFRPQTKFVVKEYAFKEDAKEDEKSVGKFVMDLVAGGFRTITGLIPKSNPDDYQVKTPVATIGVRGTDYTVIISAGQAGPEVVIGQLAGIPTVRAGGGAPIELNASNRYAKVLSDGSVVISTKRPPILETDLPIIPATIKPITSSEAASQFNTTGGSGEWCIL